MTPDAPTLAQVWGVRLCRAFVILGLLTSSLAGAQMPNTQVMSGDPGKVITFDIPSQSLATALEAFSTTAEIELFYESNLVAGRQSSPVRGQFGPDIALRALLKGTELSATSFDHGTATILPPAKPTIAADLAEIKARAAAFSPYLALIQTSLRLALCRTAATLTDPAERPARVWIAASGDVVRAELLSSTGSDERDGAYLKALLTLAIGAAPPAAMPQPVTLLIMPRESREAAECPRQDMPVRSAGHE